MIDGRMSFTSIMMFAIALPFLMCYWAFMFLLFVIPVLVKFAIEMIKIVYNLIQNIRKTTHGG